MSLPSELLPVAREAFPARDSGTRSRGRAWLSAGSLALFLASAAGVALFVALLSWQGAGQVAGVFRSAGLGLLAVVAWHLVPLVLDAVSWWVLFPSLQRPRFSRLLGVRWLGEAVTNLLPVSLAGDIVRARWIARDGIPMRLAAASTIVNVTVGLLSQVGFTLLGVGLLTRATGVALGLGSAWELLAVVTALALFLLLQRFGIFRLLKIMTASLASAPQVSALLSRGEQLDTVIRLMYTDRPAIASCFAWSTLYWLSGCGEVWIGLSCIGQKASLLDAVIIESAIQGVRAAAFLLPGGLGAQEGGFMIVCRLLGIPGEAALALSLMRRVRELIFGVPGLLVWQALEFRRRRARCRESAAAAAAV